MPRKVQRQKRGYSCLQAVTCPTLKMYGTSSVDVCVESWTIEKVMVRGSSDVRQCRMEVWMDCLYGIEYKFEFVRTPPLIYQD